MIKISTQYRRDRNWYANATIMKLKRVERYTFGQIMLIKKITIEGINHSVMQHIVYSQHGAPIQYDIYNRFEISWVKLTSIEHVSV